MIDQIDNYTAFDLEVGQIGLKWYHWEYLQMLNVLDSKCINKEEAFMENPDMY